MMNVLETKVAEMSIGTMREYMERKRYEIAKDVLAGMVASPKYSRDLIDYFVKDAVRCADKLLAALNEKG